MILLISWFPKFHVHTDFFHERSVCFLEKQHLKITINNNNNNDDDNKSNNSNSSDDDDYNNNIIVI